MKLQFSIREVILVTIIVALCLGWWLDHKPPRYEVIDYHSQYGPRQIVVDHETAQGRELGLPFDPRNPHPHHQ